MINFHVLCSYFELFRASNVHCVVILDGAFEPDAKIATIMERNQAKMKTFRSIRVCSSLSLL